MAIFVIDYKRIETQGRNDGHTEKDHGTKGQRAEFTLQSGIILTQNKKDE
jgi:hypothetical protein